MARLALLKSQADFARFRSSRTYQVPVLRIKVHMSPNQNLPCFGFIVPKKVLSKVTDRNVVKRRIKTILDRHLEHIKPADILFFPQAKVLKLKFTDLEALIVQLFKRAHLWKS